MHCPTCGNTMEKGGIILLLRECKIPNAWYCAACNKVTGIFDVASNE